MKHTLIIAVCLLLLNSCTKKSTTGTSGTTSSASTFSITINGKTYTSGGSKITTRAYLTTSNGINKVEVVDVGNVMAVINMSGLGTGIYTIGSSTNIQTPSAVYSDNPMINPTPVGTANIIHTGADYFEGTFNFKLTDGASYVAYTMTGSFKVYH